MRTTPENAPPRLDTLTVPEDTSRKSRRYPNPGYLGPSSHTTFFEHLAGSNQHQGPNTSQDETNERSSASGCAVNEDKVEQGATFLSQIRNSAQLTAWKSLTESWAGRGINLPLAEPFTLLCASAACNAISGCDGGLSGPLEGLQTSVRTSKQLFTHTCKPLNAQIEDTIETFCELFCRTDARWETLGVFFTAVSRATIDITQFDGLYNSERERRVLRRLAMRYSDTCLDIALSLDCLNDLQLILQYENFILHSLVDGDQSKCASFPSSSWSVLNYVFCCLAARARIIQLLKGSKHCSRVPVSKTAACAALQLLAHISHFPSNCTDSARLSFVAQVGRRRQLAVCSWIP